MISNYDLNTQGNKKRLPHCTASHRCYVQERSRARWCPQPRESCWPCPADGKQHRADGPERMRGSAAKRRKDRSMNDRYQSAGRDPSLEGVRG